MGRLIDADKLQDYFWDNRSKLFQSKDCRIAIDNAPTVDAIPKAEYEARLNADLEAILVDLQLEIEEQKFDNHIDKDTWNDAISTCSEVIQQKINALKGGTDG